MRTTESGMIDYELLAAKLLRPKRDGLRSAKEALSGVTEVSDAWARLSAAGLLPPTWTSDAPRFQAPFLIPPGGSQAPGEDTSALPRSVAACLAIGSDPQGLAQAEVLAREVLRRLEPWGVPARSNVLWVLVPGLKDAGQGGEEIFSELWSALRKAPSGKQAKLLHGLAYSTANDQLYDWVEKRHRGDNLALHAASVFCDTVASAALWTFFTELGGSVPSTKYIDGTRLEMPAIGKKYADLPNPFEPLLELMFAGYWLSGATDDAIVLVGAEVESVKRAR